MQEKYFDQLSGAESTCKLVKIYPNREENDRSVRQTTTKQWKDSAKTKAASESLSIDAERLWNNATVEIKNAPTLRGAKREIKKFCKTLQM